MKQKNLLLVAVAVGCGLVAAFLTSQIGAKPAKAEDQIEVPVAAKDLTVGTKLTKDDLKGLVTYKKFNKDSLPAAFAGTEEELVDKRLVRTVRAGEPFNPQDLTTSVAISPPPGFNVMTLQTDPVKGVAGFAGPGSRVDVMAAVTLRSQGNRAVVFPLLVDMLVLAIDTNTQLPTQGAAFTNMSTVSLAVNNKHAQLLHAANNRGADLRFVLRNADKPAEWTDRPTEEEIWKILADDMATKEAEGTDPDEGKDGAKKGKVETVKLPVPTEDLPAGTALTDDVLAAKFKAIELPAPAPGNLVQDLKEHAGKFLQYPLAANQFVPKSYLGDKPPAKDAPPPAEKALPAPKKDPGEYWDVTIQTAQGATTYRYEKLKTGGYKFLGEIRPDAPAGPDGAPAPAGDAKPPKDV